MKGKSPQNKIRDGAHMMNFQNESKITTKLWDQNTIKEAHSCLVKTILQAVEKTLPKTSSENKECERENRIVRAKYRKHCSDPTNTI